jgi:hypothetical protein
MNTLSKITLVLGTGAAVTYAVVSPDPVEPEPKEPPVRMLLEPYGIPPLGFEGRVMPEEEYEYRDTIPLARIALDNVNVKDFMGEGAIDPEALKVTTWEVKLDNGKTLKLQLKGIEVTEGETQ